MQFGPQGCILDAVNWILFLFLSFVPVHQHIQHSTVANEYDLFRMSTNVTSTCVTAEEVADTRPYPRSHNSHETQSYDYESSQYAQGT